MDSDVCMVLVPYMAGDDRHSASRGPERLLAAGIAARLAAHGRVRVERIEREGILRSHRRSWTGRCRAASRSGNWRRSSAALPGASACAPRR